MFHSNNALASIQNALLTLSMSFYSTGGIESSLTLTVTAWKWGSNAFGNGAADELAQLGIPPERRFLRYFINQGNYALR